MRKAFFIAGLFCLTRLAMGGGLEQPGFEGGASPAWAGPVGGGLRGGQGTGEVVSRRDTPFVRSGDSAVCLKVWKNRDTNAVAWSSLSQTMTCEPLRRLRAEAWFLVSSNRWPLSRTGTTAHLRIEYFDDARGRYVIPSRAAMSVPFPLAAANRAGIWQKVEVMDRVPSDARALKCSVVLMSDDPTREPQAIWVDDVFVDVLSRGR